MSKVVTVYHTEYAASRMKSMTAFIQMEISALAKSSRGGKIFIRERRHARTTVGGILTHGLRV
jgi:hypothetical protein